MFHGFALAVELIGAVVVGAGGVRFVRAPVLAARRAATATVASAGDSARYARGLTDFYRISGGLGVLAGVILLLISVVAG